MLRDAVSRRRELLVIIVLGTVFAAGTFLYFLLVFQWYFIAFLAALAVLALAAGMHYLLWGRRLARQETLPNNLLRRSEHLGCSVNGVAQGTPKPQH